jgi:hypothetical protein
VLPVLAAEQRVLDARGGAPGDFEDDVDARLGDEGFGVGDDGGLACLEALFE